MKLAAKIAGVGLVGPGMTSWRETRTRMADEVAYERRPTVIPAADALPPTERRRASKGVRLALAAGLEAVAESAIPARELAAVFASSSGDGDNCHAICEALASNDRLISPTRFHNSVHNAPAGYWGIATGAMHAADSIAAFNGSVAAGLLEAVTRLAVKPDRAVLLVAYDAPYPSPLAEARPIGDAFAAALVLVSHCASHTGRPIEVALDWADPPSVMADEGLENLRQTIPAARIVPLLAALAQKKAGHARLEYLEEVSLRFAIE